MVQKTIDLEMTPMTLEELLSELDENTEILLKRGESPVARIAAAEGEVVLRQRVLGLHEGGGWISDDFTDELPESFWHGDHE